MKYRDWVAKRLIEFYERVALKRRVPDWVWKREHEAMVCLCEHSWIKVNCSQISNMEDFG